MLYSISGKMKQLYSIVTASYIKITLVSCIVNIRGVFSYRGIP